MSLRRRTDGVEEDRIDDLVQRSRGINLNIGDFAQLGFYRFQIVQDTFHLVLALKPRWASSRMTANFPAPDMPVTNTRLTFRS